MKRALIMAIVAAVPLSGCSRTGAPTGNGSHQSGGRYSGAGLYEADRTWKQLTTSGSSEPAAARLADDGYVIVVIDSQTGELRQCGNLSGHCISMNPWSKPLAQFQLAPVPLTKHADQVDEETQPSPRAVLPRPEATARPR